MCILLKSCNKSPSLTPIILLQDKESHAYYRQACFLPLQKLSSERGKSSERCRYNHIQKPLCKLNFSISLSPYPILFPSIMIISLKVFLPSCLGTGQIELKMQALLVRDLIHYLSEACHEVYGTRLSKGKDSVVFLSLWEGWGSLGCQHYRSVEQIRHFWEFQLQDLLFQLSRPIFCCCWKFVLYKEVKDYFKLLFHWKFLFLSFKEIKITKWYDTFL